VLAQRRLEDAGQEHRTKETGSNEEVWSANSDLDALRSVP